MKLDRVINIIESDFALDIQEKWDCSGLQISTKKDIKKILVCLDITNDVKTYAIENNYDLIISHHPLIFQDYCVNDEYIRSIYQQLYAHKIAIYSMHTNYDNHKEGMNVSFINKLGYEYTKDDMLVCANVDNKLIDKIKDVLNSRIIIYNKINDIKKIGVILGSGGFAIKQAYSNGCDCLISSEFKHHDILLAKHLNITLIDVFHQAEIIFCNDIKRYLSNKFDNSIKADIYIDKYSIDFN